MSFPTYWIVLFPDFNLPSGGILQLHRLAEIFISLNRKVYIVQDDPNFHPSWFSSSVPTVASSDWNYGLKLDPSSNIIILPETYVHQIPKFNIHVPKIIFNQNTSYTFGLPASGGVFKPYKILEYYNRRDVIAVCCVSEYDRNVLVTAFQIPSQKIFLIVNCIGPFPDQIDPCFQKKIVIMPRKNNRDAHIICSLLSRQECFNGWSFEPIENKPHTDVLSTLSSSGLFLSLGHPEGFGLPVAESLCCQCSVIGYSGLGGNELFTLGQSFGVAWQVAFGDYLSFISHFRQLNHILDTDRNSFLSRLRRCSTVMKSLYSNSQMSKSVYSLIQFVEKDDAL